jgi:hypothetical protein
MALAAVFPTAASTAEPAADEVLQGAGLDRGLLVHVGATDGSLAIAAAKAEPMVVLAVTADEAAAQSVRGRLVAAGVHGQATASALIAGRISLADDSAAVVVCDLDAKPPVARDELLRVLRPQGAAWLREGGAWRKVEKPRPAELDDWGQYHHDAAMTDVSANRKVGPAYGLQWVSGPQVAGDSAHGVRVSGSLLVQVDGSPTTDGGEPALVARDAWSGLPLWRRADMVPLTRYALMAQGERVYVYALNRDRGELVWRFLCTPRRELIAADGQLESPWPVLGSVTADERGIYAFAGRHTDTDGGLWWWHLDTAGNVLHQGRVGSDELKPTTPGSGPKLPTGPKVHTGMNNIAVMDGDLLLLPRLYFTRTDEGLQWWNALDQPRFTEPEFWAKRHAAGTLVPGNQGLLNRVGFLNGYKMSAYSYTQARMYARHGADFLMVGGAPQLEHRGGGGGSELRRMKRLDSLTEQTLPNPRNPDRPIIKHRGAEVVWENTEGVARGNGLVALAVAGDAVLAGLEVSQSEWRERQRMPYRLQVLNLSDGKLRQELPLSAKPIQGGIAVAGVRVIVVTADGTVACFAGAQQDD